MDRSRKANRERNEVTLQHRSRKEALRIERLVEEKLAELQASMEQLRQTPEGMAELERRTKVFGECKRIEDETPGQFYDKLRRWLERGIPQTKSPLHPPRQVGG
jgi:type IV secretory pathway VirB4 component